MKKSIRVTAFLLTVVLIFSMLSVFGVSAEQNPETLPVGGSASSTYGALYAAPLAFDGNPATRWNACSYTYNGSWLAYNFGKVVTLTDMTIVESVDSSLCFVVGHHVEAWNSATKTWETVSTGGTIGAELKITFDKPVTTRMIRIVLDDLGGRDCLTLSEVTFYHNEDIVRADLESVNGAPDLPLGISASSIFADAYSASMAYDGDLTTRWNSRTQTYNGSWLAINFGKTVTVDKINLVEYTDLSLCFVIGFSLEIWNETEGKWVSIHDDMTIGTSLEITLDSPVSCQYFRIVFTDIGGKDCLTLTEIALYNGDTEVRPMADCSASSEYASGGYSAYEAFDNCPDTRWSAADGQRDNSWLATTFSQKVTVNRVKITEAYDRITSFAIQYKNASGEWADAYTGTTVGSSFNVTFDPVETDEIRLYVNTAVGEPSIYEMACYNGDSLHLPGNATDTKHINLAQNASIFAYETLLGIGWDGSFLNNGVIEAAGGYTTFSSGVTDGKFVGYDLGKRCVIDEIVLYSANGGADNPAWSGIPKSFTVEISSNGKDWNAIGSYTNTHVATQEGVSIQFEPVYARYIIIRSSEMYQKADGVYIQLAEMEVFHDRATTLICDSAFQPYVQVRDAEEGYHDVRVVLLTNPELIKAYHSLDVTITFTVDGGVKQLKNTLGGEKSDYSLYQKITADGEIYIACEGTAIFGSVITDIPNGAYSKITVTITDGDTVVYTASTN